jgi:hypothetical protein
MQLRRIQIRDFRKLSRVLIEDLQDGLNVVVGDNEAGKSTVLAALRAALFERHRVTGAVAEAMMPYGQSVRPEVTLDFEIFGKPYRLFKAFCARPEAELTGPGERLTGDAVEERLAELFGFTAPGKGGSSPERHQGAYGLLWVEQGAAHRSLGVGAGRDALSSALEAEVGQVLGGERGRTLLAAAEERRLEFWTRTGKPGKRQTAMDDEIAELEAKAEAFRQALNQSEARVDQLAARQEALQRHERDDTLGRAQRELAAARAAWAEAGVLERSLKDAEIRSRVASLQAEQARDRHEARLKLAARAASAEAGAGAALAEAAELQRALDGREAGIAALRLAVDAARSRRDAAVAALDEVERAAAARDALAALEREAGRLALCEAAELKRGHAAEQAAKIAVTRSALAEIEAADISLKAARARLEAASVRLVFEARPGLAIRIDGAAHSGEPVSLSRDAALDLEGFGRILVKPGGGLGAVAASVEEAGRTLSASLAKAGASSVEQARAELARKADLVKTAEAEAGILAAIAPNGVDALRRDVEARKLALADGAGRTEGAGVDPLAAREALRLQSAGLEEAEAELRRAEAARAASDRDFARLSERAAGASRERDALRAELEQARHSAPDDALATALAGAEASRRDAAGAEAAARAAVEAAELETLRLRLRKAEGAEASIRADIDRLKLDAHGIESALGAIAPEGLGEQFAEAEGGLVLKRRQRAQLAQEAAAARLLQETLLQAQRETKERWLGPVRARVAPYMKLLHPDSEIVLNEDTLEIEGFVRGGRSEDFASLSMGAREQVAVITRLSLAEILKGAQLPSAVILDDALVNTDEARLERMHLVLHKAAEALQILIFTCRERDFLQLGAPIIRIA